MASADPWDEIWRSVRESQAKLREALASGSMATEDEIEIRAELADLLLQKFEDQSIPTDLYDAIQHVKTVIRRLGNPSAERAKHLDKLSYMKMSAFGITNSMRTLDESIAHAKQAKAEAEPTNDPILCKIYHNLGYSLSHRAQLAGTDADLDEAITCGWQVLRLAQPSSTEYESTVTNLAVRLDLWYRRHHKAADSEEAMALIDQQLKRHPPGTPQHGAALMVRGEVAYENFKHTDDMEDLDKALLQCEQGLALMPERHEKRVDALRKIALLYQCKHKRTTNPSDMRRALEYSGLMLNSTPAGHPIRVNFVVQHLFLLKESLALCHSMSEVQDAIKQAEPLRNEVPEGHTKRHSSGLFIDDLLARRYILSRQLSDLRGVVSHALQTCYEYSDSRDKTQPSVNTSPLYNLSSCLVKFDEATPDSPAKSQALEKMYQYFCSAYESKQLLNGLTSMQLEHGEEFNALIRHLQSAHPPSEEEIKQAMDEQFQERKKSLRQGWQPNSLAVSQGRLRILEGSAYSDGQLTSPKKLNKWLNNCYHNHGELCNSVRSDTRCASDIPLILIDVLDRCLVSATSAEKYFTLSYVWGKADMPRTLKSNVRQRLQKHSLIPSKTRKLPLTFEDAMLLVQLLGERYLWIDSLCIVQDDVEQKHREIHRMDIVYSKAFATIVAMHGADANAGLPGLRPNTRPPQQTESIWVSGRSPDLERNTSPGTEKITMVSTPSPLDFILEVSAWGSRGWILQERLLSRRHVYFSSSYVYFQCSQETLCEITLEGPAERFGEPHASRTFAKENPLTHLKQIADVSEDERMRRVFEVYKKLVEMYTVRKLSFPSDIINAFSGMLSILIEYFESSWVGPVEYRLPHSQGEPLPSPQIDVFYTHHHGRLHGINARRASAKLKPEFEQTNVSGPDFGPSVLQFWADAVDASLFHFLRDTAPDYLSKQDHIHTQGQQAVLRLQDKRGRHCGLWFNNGNDRLWQGGAMQMPELGREKQKPRELVAISRLGDVYKRREGPSRVEGEIELFDEHEFPATGPGSGMVNVLVIEWDCEVAERIAVARIHVRAWEEAAPRRKHIRLA
ncbi:hypothetical protein H2199_008908 [Coniosporium tulheliwenetii]|uniref:Uncharacterized protein n=1 Tax=Coniosporium tulheliwenetii TaxID=3383036 RepID=A0ACC2YHA6_9PEZI|nr:hypothetical protein H2199_008908 [Cladosporium sp. JES 115]